MAVACEQIATGSGFDEFNKFLNGRCLNAHGHKIEVLHKGISAGCGVLGSGFHGVYSEGFQGAAF